MKRFNLKSVMLVLQGVTLLILLFLILGSKEANVMPIWVFYGVISSAWAFLALTHKKPNKLVDYTSLDYSEGFNDGINMTIQAHQELMDAKEDHEVAMAENQAERYPE